MPTKLPDGVTQTDFERGYIHHQYTSGFKELRVGRLQYTLEFDFAKLPLARNFEATWTHGPARFHIERDDEKDRYNFTVEPAGRAGQIYRSNGSSASSGQSTSTWLRAPWDKMTWDDDRDRADATTEETTTECTAIVHLLNNPLTTSQTTSGDLAEDKTFLSVGRVLAVETDDDYTLTPRMLARQLRILARDVLEKPVYELCENDLRTLWTHYWDHDDRTTSLRKRGRKHIEEAKWKLGRRDKPLHVKVRERHRRQQEKRQQQAPPSGPPSKRPPSETNNHCPDCEGVFHKSDMDTQPVNKDNGTLTGKEWVCPDCGAVVASKVDYNGPVPVETPHGTELH